MPFRFEIDPARRLVTATADGVLTEADLRSYLASVLAHPDVRPGFHELVDLRELTGLEIPVSAIAEGIPSTIKELELQLEGTRTAVVVSQENAAMVSRLYEVFRAVVPTTVRLFDDMARALAWLGLARKGRPSQQRVAPRRDVQIDVLCRAGDREHSAQIVNLSLSGALLRCPGLSPAIGAPVAIRWEPPGVSGSSELTGAVTRHAERGFAVRFLAVTEELLRFLGDPF